MLCQFCLSYKMRVQTLTHCVLYNIMFWLDIILFYIIKALLSTFGSLLYCLLYLILYRHFCGCI